MTYNVDLGYEFSRWLLTTASEPHEDKLKKNLIDMEKMTVEAVGWLQKQGAESYHAALHGDSTIVGLVISAYVQGVNDGALFIRDMVHDERIGL